MRRPADNSIRCSCVSIDDSCVSELQGCRTVRAIPREEIRGIELRYDTRAKSPFFQFFLGFTLCALGMIGLISLFIASAGRASPVQDDPPFVVLPLIPVVLWIVIGAGLWLLIGVFRARYHLAIHTPRGIQKIFFEKKTGIREIRQFVADARLRFGYEIDACNTKDRQDIS